MRRQLPTLMETELSNIEFRAGGLNHFSILLDAKYKNDGKNKYLINVIENIIEQIISNIFFQSNIVPNREEELIGVSGIINNLDAGVVKLPDYMHIEGGDVVIHNDKLFIGTYSGEDYSELITARTNQESISYLEKMIPSKEIMSINIKKSNTDVFENVLHLDCCFQPIGKRKAIICPDSFVNKSDVEYLIGYFGKKNTYLAYGQEAYLLISNLLVISPEVIVSDKRFNKIS